MVFVHRSNIVISTGTMLSDIEEGELVKLNENGSPVDFYVAKHDYEPDLNGAGRTLLVRKDCYNTLVWNTENVNAYANANIDLFLNETYKAVLDQGIQEEIGTTKFFYTPGNGNTTVSILERAVFMLSATELGQTSSSANVEGSFLPISDTLRVAHMNGSAYPQGTRSININNTIQFLNLNTNGFIGFTNGAYNQNSRPIFTLPSTIRADDTGLIV